MSEEPRNPFGVDLALSPAGDLIVDSAGALALAGATAVLAQAIYLRIQTSPGELLMHADYGTDKPIGAKLNANALGASLASALGSIPQHDERFQRVMVGRVETPVLGDEDAEQVEVTAVAGGLALTIAGLPGEAQITEVQPTIAESPIAELEEEVELESEAEGLALAEYDAAQALIGDLEPEE